MKIGIVSFKNDIHARVVAHFLRETLRVDCDLFEADDMAGDTTLSWSLEKASIKCGGRLVDPKDWNLLWWRRVPKIQLGLEDKDEACAALINNDCLASWRGVLQDRFSGVWVSTPEATEKAANKILQLRAANKVGLKVPRTIISQDPKEIRDFYYDNNRAIIVKPVQGTHQKILYTRELKEEDLVSEIDLQSSPLIYQEKISGTEHLRVSVFGEHVYATKIYSEDLDWRGNLNVPFKKIELEPALSVLLVAVLRELNLKMGIMDVKISNEGSPVWLEVNPQGQFLFVEGIERQGLVENFSAFLLKEAQNLVAPEAEGTNEGGGTDGPVL